MSLGFREGEPDGFPNVETGQPYLVKGRIMPTNDDARDRVLKDSFPASDPPAGSSFTGGETPAKPAKQGKERPIEEIPTGTPTSDRHATETAHHHETDRLSTP